MQNQQNLPTPGSEQQEAIVSGPTKFELMLALFDHTTTKVRTVDFAVGNGAATFSGSDGAQYTTGVAVVKVAINAVERESGDGESWNFEGYEPGGATSVKGFYSTRTNTGTLKRSTR